MGHGASKNENEGQNVNSVIVNESIEIHNDDLLMDVKVIMWCLLIMVAFTLVKAYNKIMKNYKRPVFHTVNV
jgi:hypothetical protein